MLRNPLPCGRGSDPCDSNVDRGCQSRNRNRVGREIAGLLIEIDKPQLASGEEATLSFSRAPDSEALTGRYRVEFMVMPISQRFSIDVEF